MQIMGISKTYTIDNSNKIKALDNITLSFPRSGHIFIVGKSGSGKSTLLNIIGGMDRQTSGTILLVHDLTCSDNMLNAYRNDACRFCFSRCKLD